MATGDPQDRKNIFLPHSFLHLPSDSQRGGCQGVGEEQKGAHSKEISN